MLRAKNVLFMLVLLLPFIFVEMLARTFFPPPTLLDVSSQNVRLIYELNPLYPDINSLGMRQEELDPSTLHDNFVIAVIGDSHTYSSRSVKREESFPARLEHHLHALTGKRIKVLNLGVPGYNMAQELEVLRAKALPFKPDLVILQYCINDEHISDYIQPKYRWLNSAIHQSVFLTRVWTGFLYSRFGQKHLLSYVERYLPDLLLYSPGLVGTVRAQENDPAHAPHPPRNKNQVPVRYHDIIGRENLERDVRIFGELCRKAGIPALATGFIEDQDRSLYETSGFQVYSFFQIFRQLDMRDYGYDPAFTDGHFLENGSDLIGKVLADFIGKNVIPSQFT
jgi:GDSL-like Lipase/Acylhydrolase family